MGAGGSKAGSESNGDKNHPDNVKESANNFSSLKEKKRGCTDCLCLLLLLAAWITMTVVGFVAIGIIPSTELPKGVPARLTNPLDYSGRICGHDDAVKKKLYGYYMASGAVVCVKKCPTDDDYTKFHCFDDVQSAADSNPVLAWLYVSKGTCMYYTKTTPVMNRCVLDAVVGGQNVSLIASIASANNMAAVPLQYEDTKQVSNWFNQFISDIMVLRGYIFGFGLGVSVAVSFGYLYFLRIPGLLFTIIWTIVLSIEIILVIGTILLAQLVTDWKAAGTHSKYEIYAVQAFEYIGIICTVLYLCLILVLRKRIMLALEIVKQAGKALASMPIMILLPVVQCVGVSIFLVPWFFYMIYLASSGDIVLINVPNPYVTGDSLTYRTFQYSTNTKYAFLYMLFCWFWTSQFIIALGQLIIALAIAGWYFTRDKSDAGNGMVFWAARIGIFYHSGTAAFGSLIVAIVKTIRAVIAYLQSKAAKSKNYLAQAVLCCIQCCMWCIEKCIKFLNKNAYIQTAIHGYSFCKAARSAFFLILRNILRIAAVNMVSDFVLLLGKVFIPAVTTLICYLSIVYGSPNLSVDTNGIIGPMVVTYLLAYFVACMFSELYGMGIETILLCYVADEEMFDPADRFADGGLQSSLQKTAQDAASAKIGPTDNEEEKPKSGEVVSLE